MKTFFDLIQEVHKPGLCHRCGGCASRSAAPSTDVSFGGMGQGPVMVGQEAQGRAEKP
jgi:hypothetical protein